MRDLNAFQPEILVAYASMIHVLAEEAASGRLRIQPRAVSSSSEVLTPAARERVRAAWGRLPFDVYAATETGGIAAECDRHEGMHLFEDLLHAAGWQVRQEESGVHLLVAGPEGPLDSEALAGRLGEAMARAGAAPVPIRVDVVPEIPPGAAGKRPLVVARRAGGRP